MNNINVTWYFSFKKYVYYYKNINIAVSMLTFRNQKKRIQLYTYIVNEFMNLVKYAPVILIYCFNACYLFCCELSLINSPLFAVEPRKLSGLSAGLLI